MSLRSDTRAVAPVLGAVLLFGIAVVAFSGYQATVVPNQNAEVEYNHFQEVKDQMVAFRALMYSAAQTNSIRTASVDLGTHYPARLFGINPPPAAGTLATSESTYEIEINNSNDSSDSISIRFLNYTPNYNEFQPGTTVYEHGLLYLTSPNGEHILLPDTGSQPLWENNTLRLVAVHGGIKQGGTTAASVDISTHNIITTSQGNGPPETGPPPSVPPGKTKHISGNVESITLPTYLSQETWDSLLQGDEPEADVDPVSDIEPNRVTITPPDSATVVIYVVEIS